MKLAVRDRIISRNPCEKVENIKLEDKESQILFASGISFLLNDLLLLKVVVVGAVTSFPFPPFILLVILRTASFYFSKKESSNTGQ